MAKKQGRQDGNSAVKRWGVRQKERVVLRVLRGESMDIVAREEQVTVARLTQWRDRFLEGGREQMKSRRGDPVERRLKQAERKVGELTMKLELLEGKVDVVRRGRKSRR